MEVLAAAAQQEHLREGASPERSQGSSEHQSGRPRRKSGRTEAKRGSRSPGAAATHGGGSGVGGARTKAAVAAEVAEVHAERIAGEPEAALAAWTVEVHGQIPAADAAFIAARTAHAQADAARAAARDAFRSDQRSDAKSAEWHARVAATQQAHEALREAREALYRLQALAELLSKELQRRRGASSEPAGPTSSDAAAAGHMPAAPGGGAAGAAAGGQQLLVPPAPQGIKRKRGAPPEACPFCGHGYTVRDGLSSRLDATGNRRHLRRCQCRKKTPPCKNCPECKLRPDVMQLADMEAAFDLCQRLYACAICACKCPGAGKWIEGDSESQRAFKERTQRRQDELAQLGWQDASVQPASTAGATASAVTTAAPSTSLGQEADQQRPRRQQQQQPQQQQQQQQQQQPGASLLTRRLPADIRQELEQIQAARHPQGGGAQPPAGQSLSSGWQAAPPLHAHQMVAAAGRASYSHMAGGAARAGGTPGPLPASRHQDHHHHHHHHHHAAAHSRHEHHHTCSHPHEDCTSDCCSAPTVAVPGTAAAAAAAAVAGAAGLGPPLPGAAASGGGAALLWEQLAAAGWPTAAMAASLQVLPASSGGLAPQLQPEQPAPEPPELPAEVVALSQQVFAAAAGEHMASAVCAFLRRQRLTSLSDFEFLELGMLERALAPLGLPALLLNKFLVLGRRAAAATAAATPAMAAAAGLAGGEEAAAAPAVAAAAVPPAG